MGARQISKGLGTAIFVIKNDSVKTICILYEGFPSIYSLHNFLLR